ncbi:hypothetical protein CASFOL_022870 [Castilleja foliolosa]|uniref:Transcription initiation factor TFIID subunit 1 histone acetyltransferase domain-containing protein n=1 Tax=Castilleja foliolosa TaxID=1961234 RepID=A0ABD3CTP0_9LAMI
MRFDCQRCGAGDGGCRGGFYGKQRRGQLLIRVELVSVDKKSLELLLHQKKIFKADDPMEEGRVTPESIVYSFETILLVLIISGKHIPSSHVCAYESMQAGQCRLKRLGITRLYLPTCLPSAMNQLPDEAIALAAASHIERELQITPWNLSSNFVSCTNQQQTREKCQEIWERQVQSLCSGDGEENESEMEANSDLDSFAEDLENLLDAEEGEEGEEDEDESQQDAHGCKKKEVKVVPENGDRIKKNNAFVKRVMQPEEGSSFVLTDRVTHDQKNGLISLRSERDKLALEVQFAQEKLARFMKEFDHQVYLHF